MTFKKKLNSHECILSQKLIHTHFGKCLQTNHSLYGNTFKCKETLFNKCEYLTTSHHNCLDKNALYKTL